MVLIPFVACSTERESQEGGTVEMGASDKVREPAVAGAFYPGTEEGLRSMVTDLMDKAEPPDIGGKLVGLISPHAGYVYSGGAAAHGYSLLRGKSYDAVIVLAPSHRMRFRGSSVYAEGPYRTPLGLVGIHKELAEAISGADESIAFQPQAHLQEHSLEVQLPFLQVAVPGLKIVPVVVGDQSLENCARLAKAIVGAVKDLNVMLVASTDLAHTNSYDQTVRMDKILVEKVLAYDVEGLAESLAAGKCQACGAGPMITLMLAGKELGAARVVKLKQTNSGDVSGNMDYVVGYLSAAIVAEAGEAGEDVGVDLGLGQEEKAVLLRLARRQIETKVRGEPGPGPPGEELDRHPRLKEKMGAFVTLTIEGRLRGCIGQIRGVEPLHSAVARMAVAAATEDPRFPALRPSELDQIAIEISVLTPFRRIDDPEEIEVGRDGIYIEKGPNHGLLLPQVATDYSWDRYEFLDHTCMKAGLPEGAWKEGATIQIFSGQIFNEAEVFGESGRP
jgi:AmmeMemoRadiSam system protein B/AmmeMemoRadiSam system protein A